MSDTLDLHLPDALVGLSLVNQAKVYAKECAAGKAYLSRGEKPAEAFDELCRRLDTYLSFDQAGRRCALQHELYMAAQYAPIVARLEDKPPYLSGILHCHLEELLSKSTHVRFYYNRYAMGVPADQFLESVAEYFILCEWFADVHIFLESLLSSDFDSVRNWLSSYKVVLAWTSEAEYWEHLERSPPRLSKNLPMLESFMFADEMIERFKAGASIPF